MSKRLTVGLVALGAVLMAARPVSELQLFTQLNGQPVRWTLPDGGQSGIFTVPDGGAANTFGCMPILGGTLEGAPYIPSVLLLMPETPVNVCVRPQVNANGLALPWDGGCNGNTGDINGGVAWQPWVPFFSVPHPKATHVCVASDAGYVRVQVSSMQ